MKKSNRQPWMDAADFGRSLGPGIGFNLLVRDMPRMVEFATQVLGAQSPYSDEDFAVFIGHGAVWMAHADHSYLDNPLSGILQGAETRGAASCHGRDRQETRSDRGDQPSVCGIAGGRRPSQRG